MAKRGPAGRDGDEPRDANPGTAGDDRVTAAADELYSADPAEFTDRRKALGDAARAAGDTAAAKRIAALRKPTRAAWVVNQLARADPGAPDRLAGLAAALREAEQAKDGPRLRELSAVRGPLVDSLTAQALAAAGVADPPSGLREEVTETLTSAIADPEVAAEFAAGHADPRRAVGRLRAGLVRRNPVRHRTRRRARHGRGRADPAPLARRSLS